MLTSLLALLVFIVGLMAQGQAQAQNQDRLVITTRSTGTMFAYGVAQSDLQLPQGQFDYELIITTEVARSFLNDDPLWLRDSGYGTVSLTANGVRWTDRDPNMYLFTDARFVSNFSVEAPGENFVHDIFTVLSIGWVLDGYHRVGWPAGGFPGTQGFDDQTWTFDGPGVGEASFRLHAGSESAGWIEGTANRFEMSISAVPEPGQAVLLAAGASLLGWLRGRNRRRAVPFCTDEVKPRPCRARPRHPPIHPGAATRC